MNFTEFIALKNSLTKATPGGKLFYNKSDDEDGFGAVFQRAGGWCKPVNGRQVDLSLLSRRCEKQ